MIQFAPVTRLDSSLVSEGAKMNAGVSVGPIGDFGLKDPSLTTHAVPSVIPFAKLLHFSSVILYLSSRIDVS